MNTNRTAVWCLTVALIAAYFYIIYRRNRKLGATRSTWEPYYFILPLMLVLITLYGYPLIDCIMMAFQNFKLSQPNKVHYNGLANFMALFKNPDFTMILRNSVVYVVASVLGQFIFGLTLALALWKKFPGRNLYQAIVFLPWAFSAFVVGLLFRWSFNGEYGVVNDLLLKLGVINERITWLGDPDLSLWVVIFAMIWVGIPFFAIMILAALQSIPKDIFESAEIDACGPISCFFRITLPYIKPTIIMTLLLRTIWIFNSFDFIVIITGGGPASSSQTLPSFMYTKAFSSYDFGLASALGVVLMGILCLYALFFLMVTNYNKAGDF